MEFPKRIRKRKKYRSQNWILYKCLRNFVQESSNLKKYEKIKFAEDVYFNGSKENVNLIVEYLINLVKRDKNLKEKLEYKKC